MATKTKTKSSTKTGTDSAQVKEDLISLLELSRSFTDEIQNIMTSKISQGTQAKALGTATRYYVESLDSLESKHA